MSMTVRDAKDAGTCFLAGVAALESGGTMRSLAMLPHSKVGEGVRELNASIGLCAYQTGAARADT